MKFYRGVAVHNDDEMANIHEVAEALSVYVFVKARDAALACGRCRNCNARKVLDSRSGLCSSPFNGCYGKAK